MRASTDEIRREVQRLNYRIAKAGVSYNSAALSKLNELANDEHMNFPAIVGEVESLIK